MNDPGFNGGAGRFRVTPTSLNPFHVEGPGHVGTKSEVRVDE
jgi:hypothetical protein